GELPDADLGDTAVTQLADIEPPGEVQGRRVQRHLLVLTEHVVTELHLDNGATTRRAAVHLDATPLGQIGVSRQRFGVTGQALPVGSALGQQDVEVVPRSGLVALVVFPLLDALDHCAGNPAHPLDALDPFQADTGSGEGCERPGLTFGRTPTLTADGSGHAGKPAGAGEQRTGHVPRPDGVLREGVRDPSSASEPAANSRPDGSRAEWLFAACPRDAGPEGAHNGRPQSPDG